MMLYLLACAALGYMEAILFDVCNFNNLRLFNKWHGDIHRHFVSVRIILYLWAFGITWDALLYLPAAMLIFPFVHDGVYYVARMYFNTMIIEPSKFMEQSKTTTAHMTFPFWIRSLMFVAGCMWWVFI